MSESSLALPALIESEEQLDDVLTEPTPGLVESLSGLDGDIIILGVAGKMGPTLARLARRALDQAGSTSRVIGVARFSEPGIREQLERRGIETLAGDLLEPEVLAGLPDAPNVLYLAGRKFGSTGQEELTWAMNTCLPARVAERYRKSRLVALSTGNVYPLTLVGGPGPDESHPLGPVGEYAQSCLGRERVLQYFSGHYKTPVVLVRLNYAVDLRYGVLVDVARKVHDGEPVSLAMGYANVIWQGDANTAILRSLSYAASPPFILNLTGTETLSIRQVAEQLGWLLGRKPLFEGQEEPTALLSNARRYKELLGPPRVSTELLMRWVAHWVSTGGRLLNKPTHFEARDGRF
ncbi:MAG TPA: NAD(P)-dependent oxidoreductase [Phycisphaerae bacterium]|nr:NAD(P)-dependent oxidoreductase [Phycisphaerae bacterium]HRY67087.1 NAD(P)-dependent oxidoreductase [Phycisphaerae bacterium]HSA26544.1 NAD(P)-dependent oxidoreductase [Phycisphaerae bacterium]